MLKTENQEIELFDAAPRQKGVVLFWRLKSEKFGDKLELEHKKVAEMSFIAFHKKETKTKSYQTHMSWKLCNIHWMYIHPKPNPKH